MDNLQKGSEIHFHGTSVVDRSDARRQRPVTVGSSRHGESFCGSRYRRGHQPHSGINLMLVVPPAGVGVSPVVHAFHVSAVGFFR